MRAIKTYKIAIGIMMGVLIMVILTMFFFGNKIKALQAQVMNFNSSEPPLLGNSTIAPEPTIINHSINPALEKRVSDLEELFEETN